MTRFLPLIFLVSVFSVFGLVLLIWYTDPEIAPWYIFGLFSILVFITVWGFLGTILYFVRIRFYRRFSAKWYFETSFKMAFFVAGFIALVTILALLQMVTALNLLLAVVAICLFALWSYLGKKK